MATKGEAYAGLSVAITTPFKNGEIDFGKLREQLEFQIAAGTVAVCPAGTTGESPTLTHDENERLVAETVQIAAGRLKVMAGTGSNSTAEMLRMSKRAQKDGADSLLVVAPYYNKPTQEGFYQHYKAVAEQVGLPVCVYNIPGRTGKNIEPETIIRLAELPNIALVKEATGSMDQASQITANTNLTVLSGDDSLTLPLMSIGGRGVISVVGNVVPKDMIALCKAFDAGDLAESLRLHRKLFPLCRDMLGLSTNPIPIKTAMRLLGRDAGELRLPMTQLTPGEEAKLRTTLVKYGLLG
jgi:4-hydroxy-tetrahydrodipicolinate synthase